MMEITTLVGFPRKGRTHLRSFSSFKSQINPGPLGRVRLIEVSENRGTDNQGSTVLCCDRYAMTKYSFKTVLLYCRISKTNNSS